MKKIFKLPDVGEGIAEAEIVEYLVQVGDEVKADQPVVRVETDKAVVELPSPFTGKVVEIPHNPGDAVQVGEALLVIETEAEAPAAEAAVEEEKKEAKESRGTVEAKEEAAPPPRGERAPVAPKAAAAAEAAKHVLATPHTRKLAREMGVDISTVEGTGSQGRVTDDDVRKAAAKPKVAMVQPPKGPTAAAVVVPSTDVFDFEKYGATRREPLKGIRKRTAEVMARSVSTIPHVTHFDEADVTELLHVLERNKPLAEERKVRLTLLSFLAKAVVDALRKFPAFNASLDESSGEIVFKQYYNIGFATATEAGLMVPVVRDVDKKSIMQIAADLQALAQKARDRSIDLEDMRGGTFTITNVGALGGIWATPIIVHPQVAILGSMRAAKKPVVRDDEIVVRTMLPLVLSFDHRVLDGADSANFLTHVIRLLEDPLRMLVEVA